MRQQHKPADSAAKPLPVSRRLTTRFVILHILLVFIPSVTFIGLYATNLHIQRQNEARHNVQLMLSQTASFLSNSLSRVDAIGSSFQRENALLDMMECNYTRASDELMACITYIQPMISSILATYPFINDIAIYRNEPSFLTNSELVFYLPMVDVFPYDRALLNPRVPISSFLAANPHQLRLTRDTVPTASQYVTLMHLYNRSFTRVVGTLEIQIDMDKLLILPALTNGDGSLYLMSDGITYPLNPMNGGFHLDWESGALASPTPAGMQCVSQQVEGTPLSLVYAYPAYQGTLSVLWGNVLFVSMMLLVPTTIVSFNIYRHAARLSSFEKHIRATKEADNALIPYVEKSSQDDELKEVFTAYNELIQTVDDLISQVRTAEKLTNAATYYAMSSQVNPHFMFNTLENIRMQIETECYEEASRMIFVLGHFLRYNISLRRESKLSFELEHIERYMMIYRYRNRSLVDFVMEIPADMQLDAVRCPFCMLQPIVENCLKHGLIGTRTLVIKTTIACEKSDILIHIADNGTGMTQEEIDRLNASLQEPEFLEQSGQAHVGLSNVNSRVRYYYGEGYGLRVMPNTVGGIIVCVRISRYPVGEAVK